MIQLAEPHTNPISAQRSIDAIRSSWSRNERALRRQVAVVRQRVLLGALLEPALSEMPAELTKLPPKLTPVAAP